MRRVALLDAAFDTEFFFYEYADRCTDDSLLPLWSSTLAPEGRRPPTFLTWNTVGCSTSYFTWYVDNLKMCLKFAASATRFQVVELNDRARHDRVVPKEPI